MSVTLDALARENGTFLMIAMDQRESLRAMLAEHHPEPIEDEHLVRFKLAVAQTLAPHASAFLIDRRFGFEDVVKNRLLPESCGLILAADDVLAGPEGPVSEAALDPAVDAHEAAAAGVAALKLLVIWRDDDERPRRLETARRFVDSARRADLGSVLEGVVRAADGEVDFDREGAIVEAARELASVGPSLYKVEVPLYGRGDPAETERRFREIDAVLDCPWVVLSAGVEPDDFPAAVEAACRAGASGILAGRALWRNVLADDDPTALLRERSLPRLLELGAIVDHFARPWRS